MKIISKGNVLLQHVLRYCKNAYRKYAYICKYPIPVVNSRALCILQVFLQIPCIKNEYIIVTFNKVNPIPSFKCKLKIVRVLII